MRFKLAIVWAVIAPAFLLSSTVASEVLLIDTSQRMVLTDLLVIDAVFEETYDNAQAEFSAQPGIFDEQLEDSASFPLHMGTVTSGQVTDINGQQIGGSFDASVGVGSTDSMGQSEAQAVSLLDVTFIVKQRTRARIISEMETAVNATGGSAQAFVLLYNDATGQSLFSRAATGTDSDNGEKELWLNPNSYGIDARVDISATATPDMEWPDLPETVTGSLNVAFDVFCSADVNFDSSVGTGDLLILLDKWGTCQGGTFCSADINGDGVVGSADLLVLLDQWGNCSLP